MNMRQWHEPMTLREAAAYARISPVSLRAAIHRGRLRAERRETPRGSIWYTTLYDVAHYLASRQTHKRQ